LHKSVTNTKTNTIGIFSFLILPQKVRKAPDFFRNPVLFLARSTEKDITGFFEKSACDKAFSDFFYIFYRSV